MPDRYDFLLVLNPIAPLLTAWSDVLDRGLAPEPPTSRSAPRGRSRCSSSARCSSSPGSVSSLSGSDRPRIRVEDVSVTYRTSLERAPTLKSTLLRLGRRERVIREIEALKDVSFEVPHGKVLGVVGANGAGKSTLMRSVAGILPPTAGRIEVNGRVSTLLSLGVGFNRKLTGRQNVVLGGLAAGLTRSELARSTTRSSSSPSSRTSWTCRCGRTRRACTGGSRSRSR